MSSSSPVVATPFDAMAATYSGQWSESTEGRTQREQVWRQLDPLFHAGDFILDVGCGIGDDALHFDSNGIRVVGIDSSEPMVQAARDRGVDAKHAAIESLTSIFPAQAPLFNGAISNFGALNCVSDIVPVAAALANVIRPGGVLALCVLSRFYGRESLRFLLAGDFRRATRRWTGQTEWRGMTIYYRGRRQMRRAFMSFFVPVRDTSIGGGDHHLYIFTRRPA